MEQNKREQGRLRDLARVKALRYMDDEFMTACLADDPEGVGLILRILLGKPDLKVRSVRTQAVLKNLRGRSAVMDILAEDSVGERLNVEIQRSDAGTGAKRARHNSSLLDAYSLAPGESTESLPDSYVIFITENDVLKGGQAVYPVERYVTVGEACVPFGDGSHILYVNGKYRGDDEVGRLMHDLSCPDPEQMYYEPLARRARQLKDEEKGAGTMSRIFDEVRKEAAEEAAQDKAMEIAYRMIQDGKISLEEIAKYAKLPLEEIKELEKHGLQWE